VATGQQFPANWDESDYAWTLDLPGEGHSSPVAWEDRLFVTSADRATGESVLMAIDAARGKLLWEERFGGSVYPIHLSNSFASSSPAVDAHRVYLAWIDEGRVQMSGLTHEGERLWQQEIGSFQAKHGYGTSPVVLGERVLLAHDHLGDSAVVALDGASGNLQWRLPRRSGDAAYSTPAVWTAPDGTQQVIVQSTAEGLAGLQPDTGKVIWQLADVFPRRCVSSPLVAGDLVLGGSGAGSNGYSLVCVRPVTKPGSLPELVYELRKSVSQVPTAVALGDLLFIWHDRGVVTCRDLTTAEPYWQERVGGRYYSSPVIAGEKIYCASDAGEVTVLAASIEYELLGRTALGETCHATPLVHRGHMIWRTVGRIASLPAEIPTSDEGDQP
jgi:outer membrane protein assembly factor BamB